MIITYRDIAELDALLKDTPYDEVVVEAGRQRSVLRRVGGDEWVQETTVLAEPVLLFPAGDVRTPEAKAVARPALQDGRVDIRAPLPGIFYRAPKPGAEPFVEVGSRVAPDTVVGIIETMKLMNSVGAGAGGTVVEICVANGAQVEAQDVVMRVLPESRP